MKSARDRLTQREVEVLRSICRGLSNKQIARSLGISKNTVANHIRSILLKLGARNRTEAAMVYCGQHSRTEISR